MSENIIKVDYKEEMEQSYIDYAMSVIIQRAIPDLRDGLKPVHRRILYAMKQLNLSPDKPYKKSARIVGDVLGKYHPHGDSSVYEAMVRLAQDFNTNYPLVDGQGNFGSIDGDPAAAMRYTEARLEALSFELLQGLDKDIVDFVPNFDNSSQEPEVLPAKFFNLLVNGSTGIAVGMSTNIPPHNLREVNNACKAYLENENISDRGLMRYIKGPDFPTGGTIVNKDELAQIYETGNGRVRVRGKLEVEDLKGGRKNLIVSEIPYSFAGNKTRLIENFIDLVNDKKLDEISDVRDESSKDGIRIVLEVKKGVNIDNLKNKLYQTTRLEDTVSVNMLSIVNNKPAVLSLKEMIKEYTDFLIESYKREFNFDLKNLKADKEIKEGLVEAYNIIDLIIEIIRGSKDRQSVFNCLSQGDVSNIKFKKPESKKAAAKLNFSENQARAIMKMQLQQLVGLELDKLKEELEIINSKIRDLNKLLTDSSSLKDHIIKDLDQMKDKYGVNRRTKISQVEEEDYEEKIIVEDLYALVDRFNYIKVVDEQSYTRANDETLAGFKHIIKLKSNDNICYFADDANFYQIKMEDLPISKMRDRGTPLEEGLEILYIDSRENILSKDELVFATKLGNIKRVETEEFDTIRRELFASKLKDGDKLIFVDLVDEEDKEVVMITKDKRKIRFLLDEVSKQKRNAMGVIGINLNQGDYVKKVKIDKATDKDKRNRGSKGAVVN